MKKLLTLVIVLAAFAVSCTTSKQMVYMNDLKEDSSKNNILNAKLLFETPIQVNDLLWISVGSQNIIDLPSINSAIGLPQQGGGGALGQMGGQNFGYLVEADSSIKLPYVGKLKVAGMSRISLEDTIRKALIEITKDPVVNVRFMNYRITVIGEVARPGVFNIPTERITVLEAIGMAGDLTVMGQRSDVMVIREVQGKREIGRINLLSKNLFDSPFYYLRTNDLVYIEPAPARFFARERIPQFLTLAASSLSLLLTIVTLTKL